MTDKVNYALRVSAPGGDRLSRKVLLITPPYHSGVVETAGRWPNCGYVYMAGALRAAGHEPVIYDSMSKDVGYEDIERRISEVQPDIVALTSFTACVPETVETLKRVKKLDSGIVTVVGGVHPTFMYEEMLERDGDVLDFVARGEGELTLSELADAVDGKRPVAGVKGLAYLDRGSNGGRGTGALKVNQPRPMMHDLDMFEPAWDLLDWDDYVFYPLPDSALAVISTSRGCDQKCSFCSQQKFWNRTFRGRDPEKVVDELADLKERFGVEVVMFADETPTLDEARWNRLLDLLIERDLGMHILMETRVDDLMRDKPIIEKYRQAGVRHVYLGVEATSQATLDRFNKNIAVEQSKEAIDLLKANDMISETSFVLGMPEETKESIRATLKLAKHYDPDLAFFLTIAPWPYADIYEELEPYIESRDYADYNLVAPVIKPIAMTTEELMDEVINCYRTFYLGKLAQIDDMTPEKREYFLVTMRLLMENSYLKQYIRGFGRMPQMIRDKLAKWGLVIQA
jgi:anaerobic magnesium-protoporphyrin IX monomethyl ester cyclase